MSSASMHLKNGVHIYTQHFPGWGSPPSSTVQAIFENRIMATRHAGSDSCAQEQELKRLYGKKGKRALRKTAQRKKQASELCNECGSPTYEYCVSTATKYIGGRILCKKCGENSSVPRYDSDPAHTEQRRQYFKVTGRMPKECDPLRSEFASAS